MMIPRYGAEDSSGSHGNDCGSGGDGDGADGDGADGEGLVADQTPFHPCFCEVLNHHDTGLGQ